MGRSALTKKMNTSFFLSSLTGAPLIGSVGTTENFLQIGPCLVGLIAAILGGYLTRHLHDKNRQAVPRPASVPESTTAV